MGCDGSSNRSCCSVAKSCSTLCNPMDAWQASLSFTNSWSLLRFMSIELGVLCSHLTLCMPLLLLCSIFPSISVFSNELALCIKWLEYWSFGWGVLYTEAGLWRLLLFVPSSQEELGGVMWSGLGNLKGPSGKDCGTMNTPV